MVDLKKTYARNRREWRSWLRENHKAAEGVWLIYYKKHTGRSSISYSDAVEEAICFGWIDGQIKRIDEDRYMQRYTPRRPGSLWSATNIEKARRMMGLGKMTKDGLRTFREGTKAGARVPSSKKFSVPAYLREALSRNKKAWRHFQDFPPSARLAYVYWVTTAKTEETRHKRIAKTVQQLAKNKRFGEE